jgi:hypothetical protein
LANSILPLQAKEREYMRDDSTDLSAYRRRKDRIRRLQETLATAALDVAEATGSHAYIGSIPNTTPRLFFCFGEKEQLRELLDEPGIDG